MRTSSLVVLLIASAAAGCDRVLPGANSQDSSVAQMWNQSTLVGGGQSASAIATLSWVMFIGGALILLLVIAFAALAIFGGERRGWMANRRFVIGFGIAFPAVTLSILLVYGLITSRQMLALGPPDLRIEVVGEQWWWRINYLNADGHTTLTSANEIRVPAGRVVEFVLTTPNVIHSFWVPALGGKLDMIPGRTNRYRLVADMPGVYRGQCAEYCGAQHALMAFYVVAMAEPDFDLWYARQVETAPEPNVAFLKRGKSLFLQSGCGACHVVRGTPANGSIGPDLTHVGSRLSLAAGSYPNNVGTLAGWISSSQHLKPGNHMPSFGIFRGEELRAIAEYLESLK
jgi:cytochrome c oxidase subunit II